jgi:hypothetical protein
MHGAEDIADAAALALELVSTPMLLLLLLPPLLLLLPHSTPFFFALEPPFPPSFGTTNPLVSKLL